MTENLIGNTRTIVVALLFAVLSISPGQASQIVIFGDSWAEPMAPALTAVLTDHGHGDVSVGSTEFWGLAARLSQAEGLAFITEELNRNPDVEVVHLSIGHNDVHCLLVNATCTTNWEPSMAGSSAETNILNNIIADTETIVDHISSTLPEVKIFLQSYDYMRPKNDIFIPTKGTPTEHNAVHTKWAEKAQQLADRKPALSFLNLMGLMQTTFGFDGHSYTPWDPVVVIPAGDPSLPDPTLPSPYKAFWDITHMTTEGYRIFAEGQYDGFYGPLLGGDGFRINAGLNDAWFNIDTAGQGLLIATFPERGEMFVAWFTFDTERPPENATALLGEPGHRWLTAQGTFSGDTANLTIYLTEGGVFDATEPAAETDLDGVGTMTIEFADCTQGLVTYEITSLGISGQIPIQRIVPDNVPLCEALANP